MVNIIEHGLRQKIDGGLSSISLSLSQYTVLSALEVAGRLTNAELARRCNVTPQTVNRMITQLETSGFVKKPATGQSVSGAKRTLKLDYMLTAKGTKAVCDAHIVVDKVERQFVEGLSKAEFKSLQSILKKCAVNLKISTFKESFS